MRQSLNLFSPFQVLAKFLGCSSAWLSPSEISSCQSLSFHFCASLWYTCIFPIPLPPHFSTSAKVLSCFQASHQLQQNIPFCTWYPSNCPVSVGWRAAEGQSALLTSSETSRKSCQAFPVPWVSMRKCILDAAGGRMYHCRGVREQKICFLRSQMLLIKQEPPLLSTAFYGILTVFSNFLGQIHTTAKSSGHGQVTHLAKLQS